MSNATRNVLNGSPCFISMHQYTTLCIEVENERQRYPLFRLPEHYVSACFFYSDLLRLMRENRVESGLAGGGGGHGGRRGGRGPGRNPKSILTVIASSNSLEIPSKFKELVSRVKRCRSPRRVIISSRFSVLYVHKADFLPSLCLCFVGFLWKSMTIFSPLQQFMFSCLSKLTFDNTPGAFWNPATPSRCETRVRGTIENLGGVLFLFCIHACSR